MKRVFTTLMVVLGLIFFSTPVWAASLPDLNVRAALLLDNRTGEVLYSLNAAEPAYIASLTKIVTALLFLESGRLGEEFVTSRRASLTPPMSLHLAAGERVSGLDLFYALLMASANDVAVVIAEGLSGSVEAFAREMTEKAKALGAHDTRFTNPHGLHDPNHVSTAQDIALLARYALQFPDFRAAVGLSQYQLERRGQLISNTNQLLLHYPGANGLKTGFTSAAGSCLIATAARDGLELMAVVLGAPSGGAAGTAAALLDYGFAQYTVHEAVRPGATVGTAPVTRGLRGVELVAVGGLSLVVRDPSLLEARLELVPLSAPVAAGTPAGRLEFFYHGELLGSVQLEAAQDVPLAPLHRWWKWVAGTVLVGFILYRASRPRRRRVPRWAAGWRPGHYNSLRNSTLYSTKPRRPWTPRLTRFDHHALDLTSLRPRPRKNRSNSR